jgi:hypothetical protein
MRRTVLCMLSSCALLGAVTLGMPAVAEAQTVIIINGNQPYPQPYPPPYPHQQVVYDAPDYYYGAGYGHNGYYNGGCYTNCYPRYPRPYWGW